MLPSEPAAGTPTAAVLCAGDALAVLIEAAQDPAARRTAIESALHSATGRHDIRIGVRASGRPRLEAPYPELGISMAHRGALVLGGFSPAHDVGVDIEIDDASLDVDRLARDHFNPLEAAAVAECSAAEARDLFLQLWVAKEAALKVTGRGIFDGLSEPDLVSIVPLLTVTGTGDNLVQAMLPASSRVPALDLGLRRMRWKGRYIYCALACVVASVASTGRHLRTSVGDPAR